MATPIRWAWFTTQITCVGSNEAARNWSKWDALRCLFVIAFGAKPTVAPWRREQLNTRARITRAESRECRKFCWMPWPRRRLNPANAALQHAKSRSPRQFLRELRHRSQSEAAAVTPRAPRGNRSDLKPMRHARAPKAPHRRARPSKPGQLPRFSDCQAPPQRCAKSRAAWHAESDYRESVGESL